MSRMEKTLGTAPANPDEMDAPPIEYGARFSGTVDAPTDLVFPRLTLAQGLSKAVTAEGSTAKMGDWILPSYPEEKEVLFIPMQYGISRRLPDYSPSGQIVMVDSRMETACYSPTGVEHGIGNPGIACDECPFQKWQLRPDTHNFQGNWKPCIKSYDFVGYSMTHETPVQVSFSRTSEQAGAMLEMLGFTRKFGNFMVKLSSERKTNKAGQTFATAKVQIVQPNPEAMEMAKMLLALPE